MYISVLVSLFLGISFSGIFLNKFELILIKVLIPIINYIKRNNNDPYKLKIVHYIDDEIPVAQYKPDENEIQRAEEEDLSQKEESEEKESEEKESEEKESEEKNDEDKEKEEGNEDINDLLNKINSINNKPNVVYLDENLD